MKSRSLIVLAVITVVAVVAAGWAVLDRQRSSQVASVPAALFPGLIDRVNEVVELDVDAPGLAFAIVKGADDTWSVPQRGGYPVTFETVKQAVVGIAGLKPLEAKTARPELHDKLGLKTTTDGGKGTTLTMKDGDGEVIAAVVVGRTRTPPTTTQPGRHYVRRAGEDQSWLAAGRMEVWDKIERWLDPAMPVVERKRVRAARTEKPDGELILVSRTDPDARDFVVENLPEGWRMLHDTAGNALGSALGFLSFEDVAPADSIDFDGATVAEYFTFDGLVLKVEVVLRDKLYWARFSARYAADQVRLEGLSEEQRAALLDGEAVQQEVERINQRFAGWAYRLPGYKGKDFLIARDAVIAKDDKSG